MTRLLAVASLACLLILSAAEHLAAQDLVISNARIIIGNACELELGETSSRWRTLPLEYAD
jgi:hypothetical protein